MPVAELEHNVFEANYDDEAINVSNNDGWHALSLGGRG